MEGGKEEDGKNNEPLFPRLSINDREIEGPRAPPRNKMALYEQFSIPSFHRFNPSITSPPQMGGNLVTSTSSQGYRQHRSTFVPSDVPAQLSVSLGKRVHPQSSDGMNLKSTRMEFGRYSKSQANNAISTTNGSAGNSQQAPESSNTKKLCQNNIDDFDNNYDCMVPTFLPSRVSKSSGKTATESRSSATSCTENSQKSTSSPSTKFSDKSLNGTCTNNMTSKNIEGNCTVQKDPADYVIKGSKRMQDYVGTESVSRSSSYENAVHPKYCSNDVENEVSCFNDVDVVDKGDDPRSRKGSCAEALRSQNARNEAVKFKHESEHKASQSLDLTDVKRNDVAEASLHDSTSGVVINPEDVVGAIGPKHFWKARRAIVNQQRIFAIQVFELHRVIKVQKLIATCPEVLKVDIYLNQSSLDVPTKVMPPENLRKPYHVTAIDNSSQKINESTEHPQEIEVQDLSASNNIANPWCFHPNLNQWLIPVMSPSEGLIYKPYSSLCPPGVGYVAPFYGNSAAPMSIPMLPVNYMSQASGAVPYQQPPIYFPSYGLSSTNSIVEQVSLKPMTEVISTWFQKPEASKSSEAQGTSFAYPSEKPQGGALDSNGTNGHSESSAQQGNQNRVIRVVPRNARLATESAAQIFRSIQEERKTYDS